MNLTEAIKKLKNKEIKSQDLVKECLDSIEKQKDLNAFISVSPDSLEKANEIDKKIDSGKELSEISGIPSAIKDNISVKGMRMTAGSKMLDDYISPYNATVIERLEGQIIMGKTNLDSFAFGSSTENSGFFVSKNPWDKSKSPGGSSGGSAVAVASNMAYFALGTDTGGSIRQPASFCGIVGLKPTYGRVSRYGLAAMGSSLDCPGPLTRTVEDAAIILKHIAGNDDYDSTVLDLPIPDYSSFDSVKGLKAGVPKQFFSEEFIQGLDSDVKQQIEGTIKILQNLGVEIIEISLPNILNSLPVYYIITPSEITANMSRYDGIRYGATTNEPKDINDLYTSSRKVFEEEVKRRIFIGNYSLSSGYYDAYYNKAMQVRTIIINEVNEAFKKVDFIVGPTSPVTAFNIGKFVDDPLSMYLADIYTVTANIAGVPSISIPCGLSKEMPVGFQIMGKQFDEKTILNVAYSLQEEIKFNDKFSPKIK